MSRVLDLSALKSFVAIVEHGGVTRAGTRLNLTQSAVSMQLKRLEESVGQPLIERSRRGMTPTPAGEQLLSYARRMLELNDEVWARMTEPCYEGDLILGAPHDVVYPHIPQVLRHFARAYPRVRVQLLSDYTQPLKEQFARGEVDVILTTEMDPGRDAELLQDGPLIWIGAPGGTAYTRRPVPLAFEHTCIFRPWVQRALDTVGIPWVMAVESISIRTVEATVSADFAVHAGIRNLLPPYLEPVDHGGTLPELPTTHIAMYVNNGRNGDLSGRLAAVVREKWANAPAMAEVRTPAE